MEVLLPPVGAREAAIVPCLTVGVVGSLANIAEVFNGRAVADGAPTVTFEPDVNYCDDDFADVRRQITARRALEIARTRRHNVLLVGPPGTGKTLMARRLPGILPPPTFTETIEPPRSIRSWASYRRPTPCCDNRSRRATSRSIGPRHRDLTRPLYARRRDESLLPVDTMAILGPNVGVRPCRSIAIT